MNSIFYSLNDYLRKKFNERVRKISINAGFNCPNRDGLKGFDGCIYCNNKAFVSAVETNIKEQVKFGIERLKKQGINKYIIYFQAYSNTYGSIGDIKSKINESLIDNGIVGIHIGTRPDTVDEEKLSYLKSLAGKYDIFIEYGLQSKHNETLGLINRGHSLEDFEKAFYMTKKMQLKTCVHIILGLPGESKSMMLETVSYLGGLGVDSIKFHHLQIVKDTLLEKMYYNNKVHLINEDEYIDILSESIARLPDNVIIARLSGTSKSELLIAPDWPSSAGAFTQKLQKFMVAKQLYQGKYK
jgi:radical SAM protein (TIGR01212 family)